MRLIDADALLETMENFFIKAEDEARYVGRRNAEVTWNDAVYMIKTASTIEPERKTGRWIENQNGTYKCNQCGYKHGRSNYCPNCGVMMS